LPTAALGISNTSGAGALDLRVSFRGPNAVEPPHYDPAAVSSKQLDSCLAAARRVCRDDGARRGQTPSCPRAGLSTPSSTALHRAERASQVRPKSADHQLDVVHRSEESDRHLCRRCPTTPTTTTLQRVDPAMAYPKMGCGRGRSPSCAQRRCRYLIVFAHGHGHHRVRLVHFTCSACPRITTTPCCIRSLP